MIDGDGGRNASMEGFIHVLIGIIQVGCRNLLYSVLVSLLPYLSSVFQSTHKFLKNYYIYEKTLLSYLPPTIEDFSDESASDRLRWQKFS